MVPSASSVHCLHRLRENQQYKQHDLHRIRCNLQHDGCMRCRSSSLEQNGKQKTRPAAGGNRSQLHFYHDQLICSFSAKYVLLAMRSTPAAMGRSNPRWHSRKRENTTSGAQTQNPVCIYNKSQIDEGVRHHRGYSVVITSSQTYGFTAAHRTQFVAGCDNIKTGSRVVRLN